MVSHPSAEILQKTRDYDNQIRQSRANVRRLWKEAERKRKRRETLCRLDEEARRIRKEFGIEDAEEDAEEDAKEDVKKDVEGNAEIIIVEDDDVIIID